MASFENSRLHPIVSLQSHHINLAGIPLVPQRGKHLEFPETHVQIKDVLISAIMFIPLIFRLKHGRRCPGLHIHPDCAVRTYAFTPDLLLGITHPVPHPPHDYR